MFSKQYIAVVLFTEEERAESPRTQSRQRNFANFLLSDEPVVFNPEELVSSTPKPCLQLPNGDFVSSPGGAEVLRDNTCSNEPTGDGFAQLGEFSYCLNCSYLLSQVLKYAHLCF